MGEAKRRGTFEERKALAVQIADERKKVAHIKRQERAAISMNNRSLLPAIVLMATSLAAELY